MKVLLCMLLLAASSASAQQESASAVFQRGRAAFSARKMDDAVKSFERAVALDPRSSEYHMWLGHGYSRQLAGANFMRQGFIARRAGAAYNKAVELDPKSIPAAEARLEFFMGAPSIVGGGMDKARAEADRIQGLSAYRGAFAKGKVEEKAEDHARAEATYRAQMRAYPDSSEPFVTLATFLQARNRFPEAFTLIDERLAKLPHDTTAMYQLGRAAALSGTELNRGEASLRRMLAMLGTGDPQWRAPAYYRLGVIREKQGDTNAARSEYQHAIDLIPTYGDAISALKKLGR
jgi:tetratricopeptide (TPR) repeat protein